jgi:hypothetical protein
VTEWPQLKVIITTADGTEHEAYLVGNLQWRYGADLAADLFVRINNYNAVVEALEAMCRQFAYRGESKDGPTLVTGGLSALEDAFDVLEWGDNHPIPDLQCDEPGCLKEATCGMPTDAGYRRVCYDHSAALLAARRKG